MAEDIKDSESEYGTEPKKAADKTNSGNSEGVAIPEEFQKQAHSLVKSASNRQQLDHIRSRVSEREQEMHKAENRKEKGKNPQSMGEFSSSDMPME